MNVEKLKEEWKNLKSKLLKKLSVLIQYDLFFRENQKEERLQIMLGKNREKLIMIFDAFQRNEKYWPDRLR